MRFIIHEQSYEKPLSSGLWRYERDGRLTGAQEHWRLNEAVDGYRILRVDLDARQAESGRSYLYHLVLNEMGWPVNFKFRLWTRSLELIGTMVWDDSVVVMTRETKDQRFEEVLPMPSESPFWFPASTGLGLLARWQAAGPVKALCLQTAGESIQEVMAPQVFDVEIKRGYWDEVDILGARQPLQRLDISWQDQKRSIWLDDDQWPRKMMRGDGLTAVETRFVPVQRITRPGQTEAQ